MAPAQEHKVASDDAARVWIEGVGEAERRLEITPARAGWEFLSFRTYTVRQGQTIDGESAGDEVCMILLSGAVTMEAAGHSWQLDGRESVFAGRPFAVYLPPGHTYRMTVLRDADCAYGHAPAEGKLPPRLITPEETTVEIRGGHNATRQITHVLDPGDAEKLLCVEVYTPSGNWSSYPPHRHDQQNPPDEVDLEEVYYYRMQPEDGWALQRLYTDDGELDEVVVARHGDAVMVRRGYHPVVAAPGYDVYYLNFLAGPTPSWAAHDDPRLAWVRGNWAGRPDRLTLPLNGG
ncbi:MAG: 5-deoxy-glucuronate isomerase [Chloroflexota bacterium]|nr:5-deoxy-glucuronate isomerase [Chloroflexota bacterium]